jgi:hypothetical protein
MKLRQSLFVSSLVLLGVVAAPGQTTANVTFDGTLTGGFDTAENLFIIAETGSTGPPGNAALMISAVGMLTKSIVPPFEVTAGLYFNAVDSITASFTSSTNFLAGPRPFTLSNGTIMGGAGAYTGATGSLTLNFTATDLITGSGSVTAGGKTTQLNLTGFHGSQGCQICERDFTNFTLAGTVNPGGAITGTARSDNTESSMNPSVSSTTVVRLAFNATDSINLFLSDTAVPILLVTGGSGAYAGATGSLMTTFAQGTSSISSHGIGTVTTPAPGAPIITQVKTAFGAGRLRTIPGFRSME